MRRLSLRAILCWLAPSAGVGTLPAQVRSTQEGTIVVDTITALPSRYLPDAHTIRIYLPPGYASSRERYPVLYANDGQDMDAVGLLATLDSLVGRGAIPPIIVVAVHANEQRLQEYGTAGVPNAQGLGSRAEGYQSFLLRELIPLIDRRYRTTAQPGSRAVMGWSLGALAAFDLAWRAGDVIGTVGVFSGSFWWRTDDRSVEAKQASRIIHRRVRETRRVPRLRIWLEAGRQDERDDRDGNGVIDAIQDTRELMDELAGRGFVEGRTMEYVEVEGSHDTTTWGRVLPQFLRWAFGDHR